MEIQYIQKGDYLYPNLTVTETPEEQVELGKYGEMHLKYLKENHYGAYRSMLYRGVLRQHCAQINEQAWERREILERELMKRFRDQAPDQNSDILGYAAWKNMIMHLSEECILTELVYTL